MKNKTININFFYIIYNQKTSYKHRQMKKEVKLINIKINNKRKGINYILEDKLSIEYGEERKGRLFCCLCFFNLRTRINLSLLPISFRAYGDF